MKREGIGQTPIITMTTNTLSRDVQESLGVGMNAHVAKPINIEILKAVLSCALEGIV